MDAASGQLRHFFPSLDEVIRKTLSGVREKRHSEDNAPLIVKKQKKHKNRGAAQNKTAAHCAAVKIIYSVTASNPAYSFNRSAPAYAYFGCHFLSSNIGLYSCLQESSSAKPQKVNASIFTEPACTRSIIPLIRL